MSIETITPKEVLRQDQIMEALQTAGAIGDDDGPSDPIRWTKKIVESFLNELFPNVPDDVNEAQARRCQTPEELFTLLIKPQMDGPTEGRYRENQTLHPLTLQINTLKIGKENWVECDCKLDGLRNIADEFNTGCMAADIIDPFLNSLERVSTCVLKEVENFNKIDGLNLAFIKYTTRGKGKKKKSLYIFHAYDPEGATGNTLSSGELPHEHFSPDFHLAFSDLEAALMAVYKRRVRVADIGEQQLLPVQPGCSQGREEEDEGEEPVDE